MPISTDKPISLDYTFVWQEGPLNMSKSVKSNLNQAYPELDDLRRRIDHVDKDLVRMLELRADLVFQVGDFKKRQNLPAHDPVREKKIKNKIRDLMSADSPLTVAEMESLFMTLVERFRFFEDVHMKQDTVLRTDEKTLIDFNRKQTVVLWGFGLLGSSLYLALQKSLPHWSFLVFDPYIEVDKFTAWKSEQRLSNIDLINEDQMKNGNLFILGGPIDANARHLEQHDFPPSSIVFDLGSTKGIMSEIFLKRCDRKHVSFSYIGGHPLAGKESSGFENGDALLFYGKTFCWVIENPKVIELRLKSTFDKIAALVGAQPLWLDAKEHDAALAWTSHLPQILSSTLARSFSEKSFSSKTQIFPGVIRELLRISGSSYSMWQSIIETNQQPLQEAISELIKQLGQTQEELRSQQGSEKIFKQSNEFYSTFKKGS